MNDLLKKIDLRNLTFVQITWKILDMQEEIKRITSINAKLTTERNNLLDDLSKHEEVLYD